MLEPYGCAVMLNRFLVALLFHYLIGKKGFPLLTAFPLRVYVLLQILCEVMLYLLITSLRPFLAYRAVHEILFPVDQEDSLYKAVTVDVFHP